MQRTGAAVYVVGIGGVAGISLKGERFLRRIAEDTGGRAFFPSREIELTPIHELVADDVTLRYVLTYTPKNQNVDGTWRRIVVKPADHELKVRARPGLLRAEPPPIRPNIEFTMTNSSPELADMSIDELEVVEDGVPQKLDAFQEATTPVSIVFALDASGSMKKVVEPVKAAARGVRRAGPAGGQPGADDVRRQGRASRTTSRRRRDWSLEAVDKYVANGGTALYDAVYDALSRLKGIEGRRVVVVMTDGRDENNPGTAPGSVHTFAQVLDRLKETDAIVFTVGLGPKIDRAGPRAARRRLRRRGVFPAGRVGARRGLQPRARDPAPPLRDQLHVHQLDARRRLAQGGDPEQQVRRRDREPRRLLRSRQVMVTRRAA